MYRQIWVHPDDRDLQRILWRKNPEDELKSYQLNTVTYGTSCASYLALKTLRKLADLERERFPLGAQCIESESFVDDFASGGHTFEEALEKRRNVESLLSSAGFPRSKWTTSHPDLLKDLNVKDVSQPTKALGIVWIPTTNQLTYQNRLNSTSNHPPTKRTVAGAVAKHFDPLGWISPIIVVAKVLMQDVWLRNLGWDEGLPEDLRTRWEIFQSNVSELSAIHLPRWTGVTAGSHLYELHGFCDSSQRAYAACVYLRIIDSDGNPLKSVLLASKTKVAPTKTVTIPRLELCGAQLLVKLIVFIKGSSFFTHLNTIAWCDSQVTLS